MNRLSFLTSLASIIILSTSSNAVTQTGQPGPERRRMLSGNNFLRPDLEIATVWVPHTSMNERG